MVVKRSRPIGSQKVRGPIGEIDEIDARIETVRKKQFTNRWNCSSRFLGKKFHLVYRAVCT
jgi:hypothetical protein